MLPEYIAHFSSNFSLMKFLVSGNVGDTSDKSSTAMSSFLFSILGFRFSYIVHWVATQNIRISYSP